MLWLVTLPAALWPTMGWATAPAMAVITFILLGAFLSLHLQLLQLLTPPRPPPPPPPGQKSEAKRHASCPPVLLYANLHCPSLQCA